jgi:divalent metal cation (Fe/Co/Zn/Cd) transporter
MASLMLGNMRALDWFLGMAALVSLVGGLLLGYQWGQPADASIVKALPASLEMMQLLRDEPLGREYARIANRD